MKHVRVITSLMLVIAMMLSLMPLTLADDPATDPTEQPSLKEAPKIEIVGATIKNDDEFFEVGVKVSPENKGFLSTGVVLEYDKRLLVPVAWDKAGTEAVGTDRTSWTQVASVPALCPSEISGKTAFAYNDKEDPNKGYLYLSAEAPVKLDKMPAGNVITVRFRYAGSGDTPEEKKLARQASKAAIMAKVGDPETPAVTEAPATTDAPEVTEEPTVTEAPQGRNTEEAESTEAPVGTEEPAGTDTPTYTEAPASTDAPYKFSTGGGAIRLAPDGIAADSPAGQQVMYCTGGIETDSDNISDRVVEYYYTNANGESEGITYDYRMPAPTFSLTEIEAGSNAGSASAADFAALVFFDWDEKTLLGSVTVGKTATAEQVNSDLMTFTKALVPQEMKPMLDDWDDAKAEAYTTYDPEHPLTSHDGYTFGRWIEYASEAFTIYGNAIQQGSSYAQTRIGEPEDIDLSNMDLSQGLILKAAYISNTKMEPVLTSNSNTRCSYTVYNDTLPANEYYSRFGTSTSYSLKFTVTRQNSDSEPVPRVRKTALRVTYKVPGRDGEIDVLSLVNMDNVDEQIVEVAAPEGATSASATVIDMGNVTDWVSGTADRSNAPLVNSAFTSADDLGYVIYGNLNYVNQQLALADAGSVSITAILTNAVYEAVAITIGSGKVNGTTSTNRNTLRNRASNNLLDAYKAKKEVLSQGGTVPVRNADIYFTQAEMGAAIEFGDYTRASETTIINN